MTMMAPGPGNGHPILGDADLAAVGAVLSEPARARMLLSLADGRALPASMLAAEAGVANSTASSHLSRLLDAGLLAVRQQGRHRYYHLAGPAVGELIEALARVAPPAAVRSLREGTRAHAIRRARTCYDHLAGRLGVALFAALIEQGMVTGGDGRHHPDHVRNDRLSAPGRDIPYRLTAYGRERLHQLGVRLPESADPAGEIPLRYCVDWTEQAHHLSGAIGGALAEWLLEQGWLQRLPRTRALLITELGARRLREELRVEVPG